ncbi:fasciclin domain-containing protein, partial [Cribrihabitans sp. XS_ASV171]
MATIFEHTAQPSFYSSLLSLVEFVDDTLPDSDLAGTLNDPQASLTLFAPTDAAFGRLAQDLGFAGDVTDGGAVTGFLTQNLPAQTLHDILTYHLLDGATLASELEYLGSITTNQGSRLDIEKPQL